MALQVQYKQGSLMPYQVVYTSADHTESFPVKRFRSRKKAMDFRTTNARMQFTQTKGGKFASVLVHFAVHHATIALGIAMTGVFLSLSGLGH